MMVCSDWCAKAGDTRAKPGAPVSTVGMNDMMSLLLGRQPDNK